MFVEVQRSKDDKAYSLFEVLVNVFIGFVEQQVNREKTQRRWEVHRTYALLELDVGRYLV